MGFKNQNMLLDDGIWIFIDWKTLAAASGHYYVAV